MVQGVVLLKLYKLRVGFHKVGAAGKEGRQGDDCEELNDVFHFPVFLEVDIDTE